jgi:8-oxo-dGTP diphosphatase
MSDMMAYTCAKCGKETNHRLRHDCVQQYVCGFALSYDGQKVALIRKNRPEWQAGKLNGIGGHVEDREDPYPAMVREFQEETGQLVMGWERFVVMHFPGARIHFYRARCSPETLDSLQSLTDEEVFVLPVEGLRVQEVIPNLHWLVPLAAYTADTYGVMEVRAGTAVSV